MKSPQNKQRLDTLSDDALYELSKKYIYLSQVDTTRGYKINRELIKMEAKRRKKIHLFHDALAAITTQYKRSVGV